MPSDTNFDPKTYQTPLPPRGQALLEFFREHGYADRAWMLTLSAPVKDPLRVSCRWLLEKWEESFKEYGAEFGQKVYYAYAASRGPEGDDAWSMHIVFQEKPKHVDWFKGWWRRYGGNAELSHHVNVLRYFCKNAIEPEASWDFGTFQRR